MTARNSLLAVTTTAALVAVPGVGWPNTRVTHGAVGARSVRHSYRSPDGRLIATISPSAKHPGSGEDMVTIGERAGLVRLRKDYGSVDGQHGYRVRKAQWSPDSRFFVYSTEASGGHQPWHFPTEVYARAFNRVRSLDATVGGVTDANFHLRRPSLLSTQVISGTLDRHRTVRVNLAKLYHGR